MSVRTIYTCDRCGVERSLQDIYVVTVSRETWNYSDGTFLTKAHLCLDCRVLLNTFLTILKPKPKAPRIPVDEPWFPIDTRK